MRGDIQDLQKSAHFWHEESVAARDTVTAILNECAELERAGRTNIPISHLREIVRWVSAINPSKVGYGEASPTSML